MVRELKDTRTDPSSGAAEARKPRSDDSFVLRLIAGGACVAAILAFSVCFTVQQGRHGVVLRFGEATRVVQDPGLHFKAPWPVERVTVLDGRTRSVSTPQTELLTRDKKNVVVVTGGAWRMSDPVLFHRALGTIENADEKIISLIVNASIAVFGRYDLSALVSTDAQTLSVAKIERDVLGAVNEVSREKYGIQAIHAGFQRVSLPEQNVAFVLEQMRAERRQHAAKFRADGQLAAARIRSAADLEAAKTRAVAEEKAAQVFGQAEAEAAEIYADVHRQAPAFYRFVRTLEGLTRTLGANTTVTLRTDAEPFNLLVEQDLGSSPDSPRSPRDETPRTTEGLHSSQLLNRHARPSKASQ